MRHSPRRPLILKRRKLPFQQSDHQPPATTTDASDEPKRKEPKPPAIQSFPDGTRIVDHPTIPGTQVVVIPKNSDLQKIIAVLSAKGKECGPHGPNKFILLSGHGTGGLVNGTISQPNFEERDHSGRTGREQSENKSDIHHSLDTKTLSGIKPLNKDLDCSPLDDSLTNIQWLGKMDGLEPDAAKRVAKKENHSPCPQTIPVAHSPDIAAAAVVLRQLVSERPPYSYMAMIQFAINSKRNRRMTLKEIYTWIEDHFPYFRDVAKPGWKNSIRHNLSLHDMFIREATPDGKVSYWTIRPEANRCLTLDQVYKPGLDPTSTPTPVPVLVLPHHQKRMVTDGKKTAFGTERKMKPLLPRADSYLVPIQLPITSSLYHLSSSSISTQLPSSASQQKPTCSREGKRVRIAPKVTHSDAPTVMLYPPLKEEIKEEQVCVPLTSETPRPPPGRKSSGSRRKQSLVLPSQEEPLLLFPDSSFFDSGVASDASSAFQDTTPDTQLDQRHEQDVSSCRDYTFKTPIKGSGGGSHLASSTPSKPSPSAAAATTLPEPWKVTPLGKGSHGVLDFSPIRTPRGPALTPQHPDYATFSFSSTPFKELPLFYNSPRERLSPTESPPAGGNPLANRSFAEGLVLDTMNDSLSKILVDISFSCLDDDELGFGNISWSEFLPQLK